ncbi:unnamed protein product [Camellia sinensis]
MNLFLEMPCKGLKPTIDTYNTMLQGLFWVGRCSTAQGLLTEMQANGQTPDYYTYCVLLDGLSKNGHIVEALLLFQELERRYYYAQYLIYRFCKNGKLEMAKNLFGLLGEAKELLVTMEETGCVPNHATYNVMVRGFLKANDHSEANIVVEKMIGRGFSADASTLATVVDLLSDNCQDHTLFHMIKKLATKVTFCKDGKLEMAKNLFGGFCEQGLLGEAKELLMTMKDTGCWPNYATYNVMVYGFLKANDYIEANILVEKMIGRVLSADASTLATIVDLLSGI